MLSKAKGGEPWFMQFRSLRVALWSAGIWGQYPILVERLAA